MERSFEDLLHGLSDESDPDLDDLITHDTDYSANLEVCVAYTWVKVLRINPEFRILRLTFHRKSASKC